MEISRANEEVKKLKKHAIIKKAENNSKLKKKKNIKSCKV